MFDRASDEDPLHEIMSRLLDRPVQTDTRDMHLSTRILGAPLLALIFLAATPSPARADVTAFLGSMRREAATSAQLTTTHAMTGASVGIGLLVVGFEFEGAVQAEDTVRQVAGLKTGMANVLVQTPTGNAQLYATLGGGLYQETLNLDSHINLATNIGGGLKLGLAGPLRLRLDYRLIRLRDTDVTVNVHRLYAGVNLKF